MAGQVEAIRIAPEREQLPEPVDSIVVTPEAIPLRSILELPKSDGPVFPAGSDPQTVMADLKSINRADVPAHHVRIR